MTALLLDVMGTLVWDPVVLLPGLFGHADWRTLHAERDRTAWVEFEHGRIDEAAFLDRFFADGRDYDRQGLQRTMWEGYRLLPGIEPLLAELRAAEVPMHALSNYPSWWEEIEARLGLSRFLSWDFVSCRTGVRKPDPEAYLGAARSLGVEPGRCLFVDDRRANVLAAEAVGMPALLFTDAEALRRELAARGVLRPSSTLRGGSSTPEETYRSSPSPRYPRRQ